MIRRWDIVIDVGELLLEAGVVKIKVLSDRYVLYGHKDTVLDVIIDGAYRVIKAFLKGQKVTGNGKTFSVTSVMADAIKERRKEVDLTLSMIKSSVIEYIPEEKKEKVSRILDKELLARL
nr:MAG TPA: hypothetical protein [Caudoviricetes sp.]